MRTNSDAKGAAGIGSAQRQLDLLYIVQAVASTRLACCTWPPQRFCDCARSRAARRAARGEFLNGQIEVIDELRPRIQRRGRIVPHERRA